MKKCCQMLAKYFGVMAVVFLVLGLVTPTSWLWILGKVQGVSVLSVLLGVIMFGMGTTLDLKDFLVIFRRPRDIFLGALAQYTIMPFLAFALGTLFALEPGLTAGLVLLGACPGGTTSNVITYMSKGDLAYSVTMTSVSTLLSPVLTPALTFFLIGKEIAFDPVGMFLSILQIVILPVCLGLHTYTIGTCFHIDKGYTVLPVLQRNPIAIVDTVVIRHTPVTETHRGEFYTERLVAMRKIHLVHHRKPTVYNRVMS